MPANIWMIYESGLTAAAEATLISCNVIHYTHVIPGGRTLLLVH